MAAEKCVICLIGAMDRLWYHQIILFSEPSLFNIQENPKTASFPAESPAKVPAVSQQETSPVASVITGSQDDTTRQESDFKETTNELRPTRLNLVSSKTRFHSSSPISAQKQTRNLGYSNFSGRLHKTMSCKSLLELELEEVKGFTDLGFIFRKENLSKRMMRLIPGLRRLDSHNKNQEQETLDRFGLSRSNDDEIEDEEKRGIMRPYLSEAWIVKRPNSPLLNLRIPRVSTADDMKKHLKYWARTVASAIQQES